MPGWEGPRSKEAEVGQNGTWGAIWRDGSQPFAHAGASLELSSQLLLGLCWSCTKDHYLCCEHKRGYTADLTDLGGYMASLTQ